MKIIKEGDPSKNRYPKRFICNQCGCVFEADNSEYNQAYDHGETSYLADCPACGKTCEIPPDQKG